MALLVCAAFIGGPLPQAAAADCSADQELLGLLRWVDHMVDRGAGMHRSDIDTLGVRYRGLMASRNLARLREGGHLRDGAAMPQLLALTESIVASGRIGDLNALNGALNAVYLQLSDECEEKLGSTLKDWVLDSRELVEDDVKTTAGSGGGRVAHTHSAVRVAGLALSLVALIGVIFGFRTLWLWIGKLAARRGACRIGCDLIIGDFRFQGFITILARTACRFEFPTSTLNEFRTALAHTTTCTVAIGGTQLPGAVQTLRPSSIRIDFHKALDRRLRATLLARSLGPILQGRESAEVTGTDAGGPAPVPGDGPATGAALRGPRAGSPPGSPARVNPPRPTAVP